jgi:hypothetical protein
MNERWVLVVDGDGFSLCDNNNDGEVVIDSSTLFRDEKGWIELLDPKRLYEFYSKCDTERGNSFGLRARK